MFDRKIYYKNYWKTRPEQYEIHKAKVREYNRSHPKSNDNKKHSKNWRKNLKIEIFSHYSGTNPPQCANPFGEHDKPYTTLEALSIDHINNDGAERRRNNKQNTSSRIYLWLKKKKYPEGFQVLCMNCQWIKKHKFEESKILYSEP